MDGFKFICVSVTTSLKVAKPLHWFLLFQSGNYGLLTQSPSSKTLIAICTSTRGTPLMSLFRNLTTLCELCWIVMLPSRENISIDFRLHG